MFIPKVGWPVVRRVLSRLCKQQASPAPTGMHDDATLRSSSGAHTELLSKVASASEEVQKDIEVAARNGRVIDALTWKLYTIDLDQVGIMASILAAEEQALTHEMERLEAMFPMPIPVIEPEPEAPKRVKHFPRLGNLPGGRRPNGLH